MSRFGQYILFTLIAASALTPLFLPSLAAPVWLGLGLGAVVLLVMATCKSDPASMVATAPFVPVLASICAILLYLAFPGGGTAPASGGTLALALWWLVASSCVR